MASDSDTANLPNQQHPQWAGDRRIVDSLLNGEPTPYNLAELARLRIRYQGFPGAQDIQRDLDRLLTQWQLTEDDLFAQTRQLHQTRQVYQAKNSNQEDWS
jgi:hypothetical protein